jgi:hypothetical protein
LALPFDSPSPQIFLRIDGFDHINIATKRKPLKNSKKERSQLDVSRFLLYTSFNIALKYTGS